MKGYFLFSMLLYLFSAQACKKESHAPASGVKVSGGQEVKTDFPHKNALVGLFFQYNKETASLLFDAYLLGKDEFQGFMSRVQKNPSEVGWLPLGSGTVAMAIGNNQACATTATHIAGIGPKKFAPTHVLQGDDLRPENLNKNLALKKVKAFQVLKWQPFKELTHSLDVPDLAVVTFASEDATFNPVPRARPSTIAKGSVLSIAGFGISETAIYGLARWLDTKEIPTASLPEDLPKTGNEVLFLEARIHRTACSRDSGGPLVTKASDGKYLQTGLILGGTVQKCLAEKEWEKQNGIMFIQSFENHLEWIETTCKKSL